MLQFHVGISLVAMVASAWCIYELLSGRISAIAVASFFVTNAVTSLTGFPLAPFGFDPARAVGIICLVALLAGAIAIYGRALSGIWHGVFIATVFLASYFNFFVGLTQAFQKLPAFQALAPTQSEAPFIVSQLLLLVIFGAMAFAAFRKLRGRGTQTHAVPGAGQ